MPTTFFFCGVMLVGVPIGICLCLAGLAFIFSTGATVLLQSFPSQMFAGVDSYGLIAIPLFILIGEIMNSGGITRRLVDLSMAFVGSIKGGLAYVNILANMLVSSIIGSATAQVAIMSQVMVPEMEKQGYDNYPRSARKTLRERATTVIQASPTLLIPVVIVGSILGGVANPTEAAAVGALAAALVGRYVTKEFDLRTMPAILLRSAIYSAIVLFLVAAAAVFSWLLIYGKIPQMVAAWIQTIAHSPVEFLLLANVILLIIGTVIDGIPGLIMTVPILLPIATEVYHIDPRHFGVVIVINLVLGLMSPPVGLSFFVASAVTGAKPGKMFMVTLPFFLISCVALVLLSLFPSLSIGLLD